jgi:hypothetical protein
MPATSELIFSLLADITDRLLSPDEGLREAATAPCHHHAAFAAASEEYVFFAQRSRSEYRQP